MGEGVVASAVMRIVCILVVAVIAACAAPARAPAGGSECPCAVACDCFGVDDPERDEARRRARAACESAGVSCGCPPCDAP